MTRFAPRHRLSSRSTVVRAVAPAAARAGRRAATRRSVGAAIALAAVAPLVSTACAKTATESTILEADDLKSSPDLPFDRNEIVAPGAFTDAQALDVPTIQQFLERTPYKTPTFLSTYQSNGIRAADAIVNAAVAHGINPLVILVRAQMEQGLLGAQFYPFPPARIEYVFNCGCPGGGVACDANLAGFDRQADCLARRLRASLDEIAGPAQATAGGWGPGKEAISLDGFKVTPADASTAALYQYEPIVGTGKRGNWLFWNIWQEYAAFIEYDGPVASTSTGSWIGDACAGDTNTCNGIPGGFCATNFPGGMCTVDCAANPCPIDPSHPDTFCADFLEAGGFCLAVCNPGVPGSCHDGYECKTVIQFGSPTSARFACVPKTGAPTGGGAPGSGLARRSLRTIAR